MTFLLRFLGYDTFFFSLRLVIHWHRWTSASESVLLFKGLDKLGEWNGGCERQSSEWCEIVSWPGLDEWDYERANRNIRRQYKNQSCVSDSRADEIVCVVHIRSMSIYLLIPK